MRRYIRFYGGTGWCGEDFEDFNDYEETIPDRELDLRADEYAMDNAMNYFIPSISEDDFDTEEDFLVALDDEEQEYYEQVWGTWEEISRDKYLEETMEK